MKKTLLSCALFRGVREEELEGLLGCLGARERAYEKGQVILAEGDKADRMGLLLEGSAQVIREDYDGNRSIVTWLGPGDLFAEAFACAGLAAMPVSVVAAEDSRALLVEAHRIFHTCSHACAFHQQLIFNLMKILADKNLMCNRKIEMISRRTTREKLMTYLKLEAKRKGSASFCIPFSRQELADYLEVDRSGLSAEISKLRREGVLECSRNHFELLGEEEK